jgi:CheY-specific phosphatase CheX
VAEISDILGEIGNTIVGNFRSNLSDAGLQCRLSVPQVTTDDQFTPPECGPGRHHTYAFQHDGQPLCVDIIVESTE